MVVIVTTFEAGFNQPQDICSDVDEIPYEHPCCKFKDELEIDVFTLPFKFLCMWGFFL